MFCCNCHDKCSRCIPYKLAVESDSGIVRLILDTSEIDLVIESD